MHSYKWGLLLGDSSAEDGVREDASTLRWWGLRWEIKRKTIHRIPLCQPKTWCDTIIKLGALFLLKGGGFTAAILQCLMISLHDVACSHALKKTEVLLCIDFPLSSHSDVVLIFLTTNKRYVLSLVSVVGVTRNNCWALSAVSVGTVLSLSKPCVALYSHRICQKPHSQTAKFTHKHTHMYRDTHQRCSQAIFQVKP